jgi:arylsulfatase
MLEAARLPEPKVVNGTPQRPMDGVSMAYSFDDAGAEDRHVTQYFEMFGNRAIYHEGWFARTTHKAPWEPKPRRALADDIWELYDTRADFSLVDDLAAKQPQKMADLKALFMQEAERNQALPIDDRVFERINAEMVGRPDLMAGRSSLVLAEGMTGMTENVFLNIKNKSKTITAEIEVPQGRANGTILAQGGRFGGWSLYVKDGVPGYAYNFLGLARSSVSGTQALPPGKATIKLDFAYDGGGLGKGGAGTLFVNGQKVAEGRIEHTQAGLFSADETADVGIDLGTPVVEAIGAEARSRFTGRIPKVTIEVRDATSAADAAVSQAQKDVARRTE